MGKGERIMELGDYVMGLYGYIMRWRCSVIGLWCGAGSAGGVAGGSDGVCGSGVDMVKYSGFLVASGVW